LAGLLHENIHGNRYSDWYAPPEPGGDRLALALEILELK